MKLAITALGMITPVGQDVKTACASLRAGIGCRREIPYFTEVEEESQNAVPVIGCPISDYGEGFHIVGWWMRVGVGCFQNLVAEGNLPSNADRDFWTRTGVTVVLPTIDDDRFEGDETCTPELMKDVFVDPFLQVLSYPIRIGNCEVICVGHAGTIAGVDRARQLISEEALDRVLILALDSYLDPMTLEWLASRQRLKTAENAFGLTPGEAGACFLLESLDLAQKRGAAIKAIPLTPALRREENHFLSDEQNQGEALSEAITEALASSPGPLPFDGDVYSDFNGEPWRAYELGIARTRTQESLSPDASFIFPSDSFGEIGAASGAASLCAASRAFRRNYSHGDTTLIVSSSDNGHVGAICVSRP